MHANEYNGMIRLMADAPSQSV